MLLNTLNRAISLFLIGGFAVILLAVYESDRIGEFLLAYPFEPGWGPMAGVFLAVGLLSVTALTGSLIDAFGSLTVRRFIRRVISKNKDRCKWFLCRNEFKEMDQWREALEEAFGKNHQHLALARRKGMLKSYSAGLLFRTGGKEHLEWLNQHHSMYQLSADFVVILLGVFLYSLYRGLIGTPILSLAGAYLLTTFSLDNYLYAYQLAFRNAYLALQDKSESEPAGQTRRRKDPAPVILD